MEDNRMFSEMLRSARERLRFRSPEEAAQRAGAVWDGEKQVILLPSLGQRVTVRCPSWEIMPPLPGWHALLALHYLDLADGAPLGETLISFSGMRDGLIRGGGFDRSSEAALGRLLRSLSLPELEARCRRLGGETLRLNSDFASRLPLFPRFPLTLKVWLGDEEFPASGRLFPDAAADHYLTVEDAVTAGELVLSALSEP